MMTCLVVISEGKPGMSRLFLVILYEEGGTNNRAAKKKDHSFELSSPPKIKTDRHKTV